jgi:transcriptional regulator with XRE-family HTH domain
MEKVPFLVRRARLLLGETQMQFAERFGVEDGTVSRWERWKLRPHPQALKQMRKIVIREGSFLSDALIRASHLAKIVTPINDLTRALVVSEGVKDAQEAEIMIALLRALRDKGITALPIHDCALVPVSKWEEARGTMLSTFKEITGIEGVAKVRLPELP